MREMIQKWLTMEVNNPTDDERLYEIVMKSSGNKVGIQDFEDVIKTLDKKLDAYTLYSRYEDLYFFMEYYKQNAK